MEIESNKVQVELFSKTFHMQILPRIILHHRFKQNKGKSGGVEKYLHNKIGNKLLLVPILKLSIFKILPKVFSQNNISIFTDAIFAVYDLKNNL